MSNEYESFIEKGRALIKASSISVTKTTPSKELLRELYLAREYLTSQKGQYKDPDADNYLVYSWTSYCKEIGITYQMANYWLRNVVPNEKEAVNKKRRRA